jgi:hypothetical protein
MQVGEQIVDGADRDQLTASRRQDRIFYGKLEFEDDLWGASPRRADGALG